MLKVNQFYWNLYKNSPEGQEAIQLFSNATRKETSYDDFIDLLYTYNRDNFLNVDRQWEMRGLQYADGILCNNSLYAEKDSLSYSDMESIIDDLAKTDGYRDVIGSMVSISMFMYNRQPENYIPYLFAGQFKYLLQILEDYDIEIDPIPGKGSFEGRCKYYINICKALHSFRELNDMTGAELCAFLYDMERKAYDSKYSADSHPFPKVWMISGTKKTEEEANNKILGWQCNINTRKGDILIFYENGGTWYKQNNSSITGIWTALTDGDSDPLSYYYGSAMIGNELKVKPIPFKVISKDERLCKLPRCGAHFLGLHGDAVDTKRYEDLLSFISEWDPSFDQSQLPQLHKPFKLKVAFEDRGEMKPEKWVEEYLIKELLTQMKLSEGIDYLRQVHLQMGRRKVENEKVQDGKTDFSLFPFGNRMKSADVLIEAKAPGEMDGQDIEKTFWQAESYASRQYARLIILADGDKVLLYPRKKDGVFAFSNTPEEYAWDKIFNDIDTFNKLRDTILSYKKHGRK